MLAAVGAALFAVASAAAAADAPPKPYDFAGAWTSDYGAMSVKQKDADLTATYTSPSGRIAATVKDHTAEGYWLQHYSSRKCATARKGTIYWGRIRFTADAEGKTFAGRYSYCDDAFDARDSGNWAGKRK
jgi:hypothetical protein